MTGSMEWLDLAKSVGLVRVSGATDALVEDGEYSWCVTVVRSPDDPQCAVLKGAMRSPTPAEYRAATEVLRMAGFLRRKHERRKPAGGYEFQRELEAD